MKLIFISQPYSFNPTYAYESAKLYSQIIAEEGHIPISPVLLFNFAYDNRKDYEKVIYNCFELIKLCQEVRIMGCDSDNMSPGVACESAYAKTRGIPVVFFPLTEERYEHYKSTPIENK